MACNGDSTTFGSINAFLAVVDFGFPTSGEGDVATVTVLTPLVQASSLIICSILAAPTPDHQEFDAAIEGIVVTAANIVPGVSFDIVAGAVNNTWGRYNVAAYF